MDVGTAVGWFRRGDAREQMKLLQGILPKARGLQVSPTVTHPTGLPIGKVQLDGSLPWSLQEAATFNGEQSRGETNRPEAACML